MMYEELIIFAGLELTETYKEIFALLKKAVEETNSAWSQAIFLPNRDGRKMIRDLGKTIDELLSYDGTFDKGSPYEYYYKKNVDHIIAYHNSMMEFYKRFGVILKFKLVL